MELSTFTQNSEIFDSFDIFQFFWFGLVGESLFFFFRGIIESSLPSKTWRQTSIKNIALQGLCFKIFHISYSRELHMHIKLYFRCRRICIYCNIFGGRAEDVAGICHNFSCRAKTTNIERKPLPCDCNIHP